MEWGSKIKNIYFINQNTYQSVHDFDANRFAGFLLDEYNEYNLAMRRYAGNLERSWDKEWILSNFEKLYTYHDMRLTAVVALALEREIMLKLDKSSLLNLLNHNPFCQFEIDEWIENHIFDGYSDMLEDVSWDIHGAHRSYFKKLYPCSEKATITSLKNVLGDIHYVEYNLFFKQRTKMKKRKKKKMKCEKRRTYITWRDDEIKKFTIEDALGKLVNEWSSDRFIYFQENDPS